MVKTVWVNEDHSKNRVTIEDWDEQALYAHPGQASLTRPDDDTQTAYVTVAISYSGMNYKDALALTGAGKILRTSPLIPGIDAIGSIIDSEDSDFPIGQSVVVNGWGIGEQYNGGFSERIRVPSPWLTPIPDDLSEKEAAIFGTAGYTAALAVTAIKNVSRNTDKPIIVTGAGGGVGGFATGLLQALGYSVVCATSRMEQKPYLHSIGASDVIPLTELVASTKPLQTARYAGSVDSLGGEYLAQILAQTAPDGIVASCGLAADTVLNTTVFPFILRGVTLAGINSVYQNSEHRELAWNLLAKNRKVLEHFSVKEIGFNELEDAAKQLIDGQTTGRILVNPKLD